MHGTQSQWGVVNHNFIAANVIGKCPVKAIHNLSGGRHAYRGIRYGCCRRSAVPVVWAEGNPGDQDCFWKLRAVVHLLISYASSFPKWGNTETVAIYSSVFRGNNEVHGKDRPGFQAEADKIATLPNFMVVSFLVFFLFPNGFARKL